MSAAEDDDVLSSLYYRREDVACRSCNEEMEIVHSQNKNADIWTCLNAKCKFYKAEAQLSRLNPGQEVYLMVSQGKLLWNLVELQKAQLAETKDMNRNLKRLLDMIEFDPEVGPAAKKATESWDKHASTDISAEVKHQ